VVRFIDTTIQVIFVVQVENNLVNKLKVILIGIYQVHLVCKIVTSVAVFVDLYPFHLVLDTFTGRTIKILMEALDKGIADQGYLIFVFTGLVFPMGIEPGFIDMELRKILIPVTRHCISRTIGHPFFYPVFIDKPRRVFRIKVEQPYKTFQQ